MICCRWRSAFPIGVAASQRQANQAPAVEECRSQDSELLRAIGSFKQTEATHGIGSDRLFN
jgi:hypothetical protein